MDLDKIKGIGPAKREKLKAAGIANVEQLARCDAAAIAGKSGLPLTQVKDLKHRAAALAILEDIKGLGPGSLGAFSERGGHAVRELYAASADWLAAEIKVAQERLAELREEAEAVARHVADEARTPEGRARLAGEAKVASRKALDAAERSRDRAVSKARELRQRAPAALQRAEAAVKDAEARLRTAVQRSEAAVRAGARKAKARVGRAVDRAEAELDEPA